MLAVCITKYSTFSLSSTNMNKYEQSSDNNTHKDQ